MKKLKNIRCRACSAEAMELMADFGPQPVAHRVLSQPDEQEKRFDFALAVCNNCALVQVPEPIPPSELYAGFNFNFSSWKTEPHEPDEIAWICADGAPESVCEIGVNDGRFLAQLREQGAKLCLGIEPNPVAAERAREHGFEVFETFLTPALADEVVAAHGRFQLVVFREVFEHVPDIPEFMAAVGRLLAPDGRVFLDVPDFDSSLHGGDGTTLWEEHVNYFSERTLTRALSELGFELIETRRYDFSGGCLAAIFRHRKTDASPALVREAVELENAHNYARRIHDYRERMSRVLQEGRSDGWAVVLYGAGVRACAFSNILDLGSSIDLAIDDQPERQGLFLPGSRTPISPLDEVQAGPRGTIFLLAVNNENEHKVMPKIEARAEPTLVATVCGPRDVRAELERLEIALRGVGSD